MPSATASPSFRPPPIGVTLGVAALLNPWAWTALPIAWPFAGVPAPTASIGAWSLLGTALLALAVWRLLVRLRVADAGRAAALVFVLPGVAIGAGLLGRCDIWWAAALVMALAAASDRRHGAMLAWFGLSLGLDAQAALIAPFFLALAINRRVPPRRWTTAPLATGLTMLLAGIVGWPASIAAAADLLPAGGHAALSLDAPNVWAIVQALPLGLPLFGLALASSIGATAAFIAHFSARPLGDRALIPAALLCTLITAGLLPGLHDGHFLLAGILSVVLALTARDVAAWRVALLVQAGSALGMAGHLSGVGAPAMIGAVATIAATVALARPLLKPAANDNPPMVRCAARGV